MWVTNNLGYDITFDGVTIYKNSQQEVTDAQKTILNNNAMFTAITTEDEGLVKSDSQPAVNPQYYVRPLNAVPTLDGIPTNPKGHPAVSPAAAYDVGKKSGSSADSSGSSADLEENEEVIIDVSTYSNPVEVIPTEGKDGMEKATVTLMNIPNKLYCWQATAEGKQTRNMYCNFSKSPIDSEEFSQLVALDISNTTTETLSLSASQRILHTRVWDYERISNSQFRVVEQADDTVWTLNRASINNDITLWSTQYGQ